MSVSRSGLLSWLGRAAPVEGSVMNHTWRRSPGYVCYLGILGGLTGGVPVAAEESEADLQNTRVRYEISIGTGIWPGAGDLMGTNGGSFDAVGVHLGGAVHWPVGSFANGELLLGADLAMQSNESDIRLFVEDLSLRDLYVGPSLKWVAGRRHRYSVDLGVTYHEADIAELVGSYPNYQEIVIWEERALGAYLGATLNFKAGVLGKRSGVLVAFKAHFVDFEVDAGNLLLAQTLGPGARNLSGPIYSLGIGYRWR